MGTDKKCSVVISVRFGLVGMGRGERPKIRSEKIVDGEKERSRDRTSENFSSHLSAVD